jgi:hypothetical protein
MPFVFAIFGAVLIVAGVRGTVTGSNPNLISLVKSDLTGKPNYTEWMIAILAVGSIGYIDESLEELSRSFMILVVIGLLLHNRGFFAMLAEQGTSTDTNVPQPSNGNTISLNPNQSIITQGLQQNTPGANGLSQLPNLPALDPSLFQ